VRACQSAMEPMLLYAHEEGYKRLTLDRRKHFFPCVTSSVGIFGVNLQRPNTDQARRANMRL
jgi:hypothetical protein